MPRLYPCLSCARHVRAQETSCPFCQTTLSPREAARGGLVRGGVTASLVVGVTLALSGCDTREEPNNPGNVQVDASEVPSHANTPDDAATSEPASMAASQPDSTSQPAPTPEPYDPGSVVAEYGAPAPPDIERPVAPKYGAPPPPEWTEPDPSEERPRDKYGAPPPPSTKRRPPVPAYGGPSSPSRPEIKPMYGAPEPF